MAKILNIPVILVGGNRDFNVMANILNETSIKYFSISRPLLCESDLINRWQEGNLQPVKYASCNKCLESIGSGNEGICIFNR